MLAAISRLISNSRALPFGLIPLFYRVFIPERISIGWPRIAVNIIGTILLAGLFSLVYILVRLALKKYQAFQPIPYGPFLIITAIVLVYLA